MARLLRVKYPGAIIKKLYLVSEEFGCSQERILSKGRKKGKAREVTIYLARDMSGCSGSDLGLYFGGVSGALITIMTDRKAQRK